MHFQNRQRNFRIFKKIQLNNLQFWKKNSANNSLYYATFANKHDIQLWGPVQDLAKKERVIEQARSWRLVDDFLADPAALRYRQAPK